MNVVDLVDGLRQETGWCGGCQRVSVGTWYSVETVDGVVWGLVKRSRCAGDWLVLGLETVV